MRFHPALIVLSLIVGFLAGASVSRPLAAQQVFNLTTPQTTTVGTLHIGKMCESFDDSSITAEIHTPTHTLFAFKTYDAGTTPTGATLLHQINTGNFSVNSLWQAVVNRLTADGVIPAGSITGTAQ